MAHADFAQAWIAAWNSRDLARILALYSEDAEMASQGIVRRGVNKEGRLKGKDQLRAYWSAAVQDLPGLHFELLDVSEAPGSIVIRYRNDRGHTVSEFLRFNEDGLIVQAAAHHT